MYLVFRDGRTKNNTANKIVVDDYTTTNVDDAEDDCCYQVDGRHYQTGNDRAIDSYQCPILLSTLVALLTRQLIAIIFGSLT